jgi:ATP-dependent RNA helicase RhlE
MPNESEIYIHRIGRTARAGKSGIAISLCDVSEKRKLKSIEKLIGYSLYAKVLNSSETLILGNTNKNSTLKDKINTKNELNSNKAVKSTKKRNSAKLFSKKAKKRFAEKRKKRIEQGNHKSIEKLSAKPNKRKDKKSKNNSVKNSSLSVKKKSNNRKLSLNLDDAFHGKAHN